MFTLLHIWRVRLQPVHCIGICLVNVGKALLCFSFSRGMKEGKKGGRDRGVAILNLVIKIVMNAINFSAEGVPRFNDDRTKFCSPPNVPLLSHYL